MTWEEFLKDVDAVDPSPAFIADGRPVLAIDTKLPERAHGIVLNKKGTDNPVGEPQPSVIRLVRTLADRGNLDVSPGLNGFGDLIRKMRIHVSDASPDSVTGALLFSATQSGVSVPQEVWDLWLEPITKWEETGNAAAPDRSWPALASALAHRHFGSPDGRILYSTEEIAEAWRAVARFAAEAMQIGYDPGDISPNAPGEYLAAARAALVEERTRYLHKVFAAERHQLSLPMPGVSRKRLVDAIFTREAELAGAMKVFARNDTETSPLGQGYGFLLIERSNLKDSIPDAWMTISVDPRAGVHLSDLWIELERREIEAWKAAGRQRPLFRQGESREVASLKPFGRRFHEPWYIDRSRTLVASPARQVEMGAGLEEAASAPGSLLSAEAVREAVFALFDPLSTMRVRTDKPEERPTAGSGELVRLADVETEDIEGSEKHILIGWWPPEEPLPHPSGPAAPLPPTALRAMAARASGIASDRALLDAADIEDLETVPFGNGLAVLTDGGVFLLDTGRSGPSRIGAARNLVVRQARLAAELDNIQKELAICAKRVADDLESRDSSGAAFRRQREFAKLERRIIEARGSLDLPLSTNEAGLQSLKEALSRRWNVRRRLQDLASEVAALVVSSRTAEELRVYRIGRWAAGLGLGILAGDALVNPLTAALGLEGVFGGWEAIVVFVVTAAVTVALSLTGVRWLRERIGRKNSD